MAPDIFLWPSLGSVFSLLSPFSWRFSWKVCREPPATLVYISTLVVTLVERHHEKMSWNLDSLYLLGHLSTPVAITMSWRILSCHWPGLCHISTLEPCIESTEPNIDWDWGHGWFSKENMGSVKEEGKGNKCRIKWNVHLNYIVRLLINGMTLKNQG